MLKKLDKTKNIVIISYPRTGSSALQQHLGHIYQATHDNLGELFNPSLKLNNVYAKTNRTYEQSERIVWKRFNTIKDDRKRCIVKLFPNIFLPETILGTQILQYFIDTQSTFLILNRRNTLQAFLSFKLAEASGVWDSNQKLKRKRTRYTITKQEVVHFAVQYEKFKLMCRVVDESNKMSMVYETIMPKLMTTFKKITTDHEKWFTNISEVKQWHTQLK